MYEMEDTLGDCLKVGRPSIVGALASLTRKHQALQKTLMKQCRRFFKANLVSSALISFAPSKNFLAETLELITLVTMQF